MKLIQIIPLIAFAIYLVLLVAGVFDSMQLETRVFIVAEVVMCFLGASLYVIFKEDEKARELKREQENNKIKYRPLKGLNKSTGIMLVLCFTLAGLVSCSPTKSKFGQYVDRTSDVNGPYRIVGWDKQDRHVDVKVNEGPSESLMLENFDIVVVLNIPGDSIIAVYPEKK